MVETIKTMEHENDRYCNELFTLRKEINLMTTNMITENSKNRKTCKINILKIVDQHGTTISTKETVKDKTRKKLAGQL